MLGFDRLLGNLQTLFADVSDLRFETLEQDQGRATVIRFHLPDQTVMRGDILVILQDQEILFHGSVRTIEGAGWAIAGDAKGSRLPVRI